MLGLEMLRKSGLFQDGIGCVPGFDGPVNHKPDPGYRTEPDLMVAFARTLKSTATFPQKLLQLWGIVGQY